MSLFVRLETSFWTHRKTMRLRALIGDDALWLPPRLWCYAAQNQPDGDFSKYLPAELAMLLGYSGDAQALLEALQQAGFLDEMQIHGWAEHNCYHEVYAERAKKAANARWGNERKLKEKRAKGQEKRGEEQAQSSNASSIHRGKDRGTIEEIKTFCIEIGLPASDGEACFHKWEGKGWKNGGDAIKCWRSTIRSWKTAGYLPSQKNGQTPAPHKVSMGQHGPIKMI